MAKYRKKPVEVEATRWFQHGDHPSVTSYKVEFWEIRCDHCSKRYLDHGWVETLEGGHIVCPGDWIITGVKGEHYPVKDEIFRITYEEVG